MIQLKNKQQIAAMRDAGRIAGEALLVAQEMIREGVSTKQIDDKIRHHIERSGAIPSFLGYSGFPASACISINNEVIHGIPAYDRIIHEGDIVKVDVGAFYHGFHGDTANTFPCGAVSEEAQRLIDATRTSFEMGAAAVTADHRLGDVGAAIASHVESCGFSVVRDFIGHGVGQKLHEAPDVPNFGTPGRGVRLYHGMTFAIEPMVNAGTHKVKVLPDGWTVVTLDGKLSAHYEHTIALTENGVEFLTRV